MDISMIESNPEILQIEQEDSSALEEKLEKLERYMEKLSVRERDVLKRRFEGETFRSIGSDYSVKCDAIRVTESNAIRKLQLAFRHDKE